MSARYKTVKQCRIDIRFQGRALVAIGILAIVLGVSAQETPPDTLPSATTKGGSGIGKFDSQKKAGEAQQSKTACPPIAPCQECSGCCPVKKQRSQTEAEIAKANSLDVLERRYLKAAVYGAWVAFAGLLILMVQSYLLKRSVDAALLNAQLTANTGRAVVEINLGPPLTHFDPETGQEIFGGVIGDIFRYGVTATNHGRTVAHITSCKIGGVALYRKIFNGINSR